MAARIRYEPNYRGVGRLMQSRQMAAMLARRAQAGKAWAESVAPVRTGEYRSSFGVSSTTRGTGRWSDRAAAYLYNTSDHATAVEWQNDERVLGRAVDVIEGR
ncbi:hypothetical protein [uncultured Thermomonospora sp.]|uniref:hypothetical protein n=1 Tax=uncultured Thermomonospora sp. TaxID=671175 RepID=UPI00259B5A37|nr:hypothetical protein [uncultured Thermomonospora sp.]